MKKYNKYWNLNDNGIVLKNVSHVRFYTAYDWISEHLSNELPKVKFLLREPDPDSSTAKMTGRERRAYRSSLASKVTRQLVFPDSTIETLCVRLRKWLKDTRTEWRNTVGIYGSGGYHLYSPLVYRWDTLDWFLWAVERETKKDHIYIGEYVDKVTNEARRGYLPYQTVTMNEKVTK